MADKAFFEASLTKLLDSTKKKEKKVEKDEQPKKDEEPTPFNWLTLHGSQIGLSGARILGNKLRDYPFLKVLYPYFRILILIKDKKFRNTEILLNDLPPILPPNRYYSVFGFGQMRIHCKMCGRVFQILFEPASSQSTYSINMYSSRSSYIHRWRKRDCVLLEDLVSPLWLFRSNAIIIIILRSSFLKRTDLRE